jgi:calcineurin-like phosphoesterase family protein
MWYFTADWHLNHANIIKYCERPFLSLEEKQLVSITKNSSLPLKSIKISDETVVSMNNGIIDATNKVVKSDDNLVIIGDFSWTSTPSKKIAEFVERINCKNLYLVWGNHDNRQVLQPFFKATYDHYTFFIEGQHVFVSHYPCRSWHLSNYGSWMLYGHVHNKFNDQDNGRLSTEEKTKLELELSKFDISLETKDFDSFVSNVASIFRKKSYTLDVGIDNVRDGYAYGTPWSFNDIKFHMERKINDE